MKSSACKKAVSLAALLVLLWMAAPLWGRKLPVVQAAPTFTVTSDGVLTDVANCAGAVSIPSTVKTISGSAFRNKSQMTSVSIPDSVVTIEGGAFMGCSGLLKVTLSNSVRTMGNDVFKNCISLKSINLPKSLTSMGSGVFANCPKLTAIDTSASGSFSYENGVLYGGTKVLAIPSAATVSIKSGSTAIEKYAAISNPNLAYVILPVSMRSIGSNAFADCSSLYSINLVDPISTIESYAFARTGLTSVSLPDNLTTLSPCAFAECPSLQTVKDGSKLVTVGQEAFAKCPSLQTVSLSATVTTLRKSCFDGCSSLKTVTLADGSQLTTVSDYAFMNCKALQSVNLPDTVTSIGTCAFYQCESLRQIHIPDGVKSIKGCTFQGCKSLEELYLPNSVTYISPDSPFSGCVGLKTMRWTAGVDTIPDDAFRGCKNLQSVSLPSTLKSIGDHAFAGCTSLKQLSVPSQCTKVNSYAFYNCSSMTTLSLPGSMDFIGTYAFADCASLKSVTLPSALDLVRAGCFAGCSGLTSVTVSGDYNIGGSAFEDCTALTTVKFLTSKPRTIVACAFKNCRNLTTINLPSGCVIRESAFYGCEKWAGEVTISSSQEKVSDYTFYNCKKLRSITMQGVNEIGKYAFAGCEALDNIYLYQYDRVIRYGEGAFMGSGLTWVTLSAQETVSAKAFMNCKKLAKVTFHALTTTVEESAFEGCTALTSVTPAKNVGERAFYGCTGITKVYGSLTDVGDSAFANCSALAEVVLDSTLSHLGTSAFSGCSSLLSINIPTSLTVIPDHAFYGCAKLQSPSFHSKVTSVGNYAFYHCASIEKVTFPVGVESVGSNAYSGCTSLKTVNMTNNVASIGVYCFDGCTSLTTVYFSTALNSIPTGAFYNCTSLQQINLAQAPVTKIGAYAFYLCGAVTSVALPDSLTEICEGAFYGCDRATVTIPKAVATVGSHAISGTITVSSLNTSFAARGGALYNKSFTRLLIYPRSLTTVSLTLDSSVTAIGDAAFYGVTALKNLRLSDKVSVIPISAFSGCSNLNTITFSKNVTEIKSSAFAGCKSLYTVNYIGTMAQWDSLMAHGFNTTGNASLMNAPVLVVNFGKTASAVSFKTYPTQKNYTVGQSFDPTGMTLNVTYTDGSTDVITKGFVWSPSAFDKEGQQRLTVYYGGKELRMYMAVQPKGKTVTSVNIQKKPSKLNYHVGETFQPDGMVLKIGYSDGTTAEKTDGYTYTPSGKLTGEGQQRIAVTYAGKSTGFNIAVHPQGKNVSAIAFKSYPKKLIYKVGEVFDPDGIVLKVTYSDGTTAEKNGGYTYTPTGAFTVEGQQKVVMTYAGKTAAFYVGVNPKNKTVEGVGFRSYPTKLVYKVGDTFQPAGMVLLITYSDGTTAEKTTGYTYTPSGKLTAEGQQKVTVTYVGKTARFYIGVHPKDKTVTYVNIKIKPSKLNYHVGDTFQPAGMVLLIGYSDGTTAEKTAGYTYTPSGKLANEGQQRIAVTYAGKTTGFNIAVHPKGKTVQSVAVKTLPAKCTYNRGESFDPAGMVLKITYSDGTTAEKKGGFTYIPTGAMKTAGQTLVTVTYAGKNTSFHVTVK